jgi:D-alanine--poly(phosphoribitol) ligase subunit 1
MNYNLAFPFYTCALSNAGNTALRVNAANFSYGELAHRAQAVAEWLRKCAPEGPKRVVILGGRSWESYAGLLGACWSGAAYVPFSARLPKARLCQMFDILKPDAVLMDAEGEAALRESGIAPGYSLRAAAIEPAVSLKEPSQAEDGAAAYILFTSGSTGVPKAVAISFRAVSCFLSVMLERYPLTSADRVAQPCELSFDLSVSNIFTAWSAGAGVYVVPESQAMAPRDFLRNEAITVWFSTPSVAVFLEQMHMLRPGVFPALRYTMFAGEGLPATTAQRWLEATPNGALENLYGPTETTIACMGVRYTGPETVTPGRDLIAIGTAFKGTELMIVDETDREAPAGQRGELWIAGLQVGLGYWNDPAMTERRFPVIGGKRWYRSGDLAYRDANGLYHFQGRVDNQVKVRGFRVELGEIEAHLRDVCSSDSVVALAWPVRLGSAGGIVAFVSGTDQSASQIRAELRDRLPKHLVPDQIRVMETLPVGMTGKIDRKALAATLESGV